MPRMAPVLQVPAWVRMRERNPGIVRSLLRLLELWDLCCWRQQAHRMSLRCNLPMRLVRIRIHAATNNNITVRSNATRMSEGSISHRLLHRDRRLRIIHRLCPPCLVPACLDSLWAQVRCMDRRLLARARKAIIRMKAHILLLLDSHALGGARRRRSLVVGRDMVIRSMTIRPMDIHTMDKLISHPRHHPVLHLLCHPCHLCRLPPHCASRA
jgi:hypothetical protein